MKTAVQSATISHLDYNYETRTCTVWFRNGSNRYTYSPMTQAEFDAFKAGEGSTPPSIGRHFASHIRSNHKYKVTPLGPEAKTAEAPA